MAAGVGDVPRVLESRVAGLPEPHCHVPPIRSTSTPRFGLVWLLTPLLWALAWPVLSLLWLNRYDHRETAFIEGLYQRKQGVMGRKWQADRPDGGGRLVIVGGSATLTGIDAELMEMKLGRPTVNFGTHAGLRLDYILHRARQQLRPGDTMLFCPEYELWRYTPEAFAGFDWPYAMSYDKRYFLSLGQTRFLHTMYSVPLSDYWRSASGWGRRLRGVHHHTRPLYDLSTLSPNGDLRATLPRAGIGRVGPVWFTNVAAEPSGRIVRDFAAWARASRIRLLYCSPNTCTPDRPPTDPERASFDPFASFLQSCGFSVVDRPEDAEYPRDWFADTQYHPDAACRRVRTESLIRRLRPHLRLPAIPHPAAPRTLYLVAGDHHRPAIGNTFPHDPAALVRRLVPSPISHPDAVTPDDVARFHAAGTTVHFDDPALKTQLEQSGWRTEWALRTAARLSDWVNAYPDHLFLLAGPAGNGVVPPSLLPTSQAAGPLVAAAGTGSWAHVRRTDPSHLKTHLRSLTGRPVPQLSLELKYRPGDGGRQILVNRGNRVPSAAREGLSVVVIDPALGVVVDAATFPPDNSPAITWQMHRLVTAPPAPSAPPAPPP